jgi:hypothetical protein
VSVETAGRQLSLFEHTLDFESPPAAAVQNLPGRGEELDTLPVSPPCELRVAGLCSAAGQSLAPVS